jgi:prolyl-tRNA synthetase
MRGREFVMKDMYSCSIDEDQHNKFYNDTIDAYNHVFERLGIKDDTYMTFASGGAFTQFSHEFQTICDAGEDTIYLHRGKNIAINEDVLDDENLNKLGIKREELEIVKTAEVGNIFNFGTKKSEDTDFSFTNSEGVKQFVYFGSYGIGITRLMGVIVEKFNDEKGLIWPENVSPFKVYLLSIGKNKAVAQANAIYKELTDKGIEVLYDDRDMHPGQKFADSELMGIPFRVTVSDRMLENNEYELVERKNGQKSVLTHEQLLAKLG